MRLKIALLHVWFLVLSFLAPWFERIRSVDWYSWGGGWMRPLLNEYGFANFRTQYRAQTVVDFVSGARRKIELDRGNLYRRVLLHVTGEMAVSGGATNGALTDEGVLNLLPEIALVGDGRVYLKRAPAKILTQKGRVWTGVDPFQSDPAVGVGTNAFSFDVPLWFENVFSRPYDTMLDSAKYSRLELQLLWGTVGDLIQGGDRAEVLQNVQAAVMSFESIVSPFKKYGTHLDHVIDREVTASTDRFLIELPTGNIIPFLTLLSTDQDANGKDVAQDDIINYVTIRGRSGVVYMDRVPWLHLKGENQVESGIRPDTGYAYINPTEDGLLSTAFVTNPDDDLILELDVTKGTNETRVRVGVTEIIPALIMAGVR